MVDHIRDLDVNKSYILILNNREFLITCRKDLMTFLRIREKLLKIKAKHKKERKIMQRFKKAVKLLEGRRFNEAKLILEELLSEDPKNRDILYNLGMCYSELDRPELAIKILSKCIKYFPHYSNAYVAIGFAHTKLTNFEEAKTFFSKALEIDPYNSYALRNLGGLFGEEGDDIRAIEFLKKSFDINPDDQNTAYGLGLSYFNTGDFTSADNYLRKAIQINETTVLAQMAKDILREIAVINLKSKGFRTDAMFYCLAALQLYETKSFEEMRQITFEIGMKGSQGFDVNDPDKKYTLSSLDGVFSGLQLVSYMYVGFKKINPEMDIGVDLSEEYQSALRLKDIKGKHEYTIH